MSHLYLIGLGSNQRHRNFGGPKAILSSALSSIELTGSKVLASSPSYRSRPVGPSQREYANAAAVVDTALTPHAMLAMLQGVERLHDRNRRGQRWRARTLDCDIVLWSGGIIADSDLRIPHPRFRERAFVLGPAATIAPQWRDPITGLTIAQLYARLTRPRTLPSAPRVPSVKFGPLAQSVEQLTFNQ